MDIIRFFILTEDELIIYPPEDHSKIYINNATDFSYCNSDVSYKWFPNFYSCVYYNILVELYYFEGITFLLDINDFNDLIYTICIPYTYFRGNNLNSILCIDVNFGPLINSLNFAKTNNFDFGFARVIDSNTSDLGYEISIIYSTNRNISEVKEVFNSSEYTPEAYVIKDGKLENYYFYYIFYLETTKILKSHPGLEVNIADLENEYRYSFIEKARYMLINNSNGFLSEKFNKTTCRKNINNNEYECLVDEFKINFKTPFKLIINETTEDIIDTNVEKVLEFGYLILYSITNTHRKINLKDIDTMIKIKLFRIFFFYFFIMFIIFSFYILFIALLSKYFLSSIGDLINKMNNIKSNEEKDNKIFNANNEMLILNNIYELQNDCRKITEIFEKENILKGHITELNYLLDNIKNNNIKKICNSIFGIIYFNNSIYNLSEKEFKSTLIFIEEYEHKLKIEGKDDVDKIKEEIKRSNNALYLNEYSKFENLDEHMIKTIYLNIYKQRYIYLYAMTQYNLAYEVNKENNDYNKKNDKILKEKRDKYFKEAILYFNKCKKINKLLGINQIKIIYSLIMISKCYLILKDYKNSIHSINEALFSYYNFSHIFSKNNSNRYNPKIMLFVETNIFNYILLTYSDICSSFHKPFASNWIISKIFETSPFILSNVHYSAGIHIMKFLEKNKNIISRYNNNIFDCSKRYDRFKKYYNKILSRLYEKNFIDNDSKKGEKNTKKNKNQTFKENTKSFKCKSTLYSTKTKSIYNIKNLRLKKNITICINENINGKIKWDEFKDVMIKFLKKYFTNNEDDKFGFVQFGINGLITKSFLSKPLNQIISYLYKTKINLEFINDSMKNKSPIFIGIYDIFDSIINSYPKTEENDNIILLFIDEKDIRFSSINDCLNIVEALNECNSSVFFFCFNDIIGNEKINNIQSFLNGLIEGYFFQIKNYQQLKEIFVYLSTKNFESNFFNYYYECFDYNL